jgi:hypothetical protein
VRSSGLRQCNRTSVALHHTADVRANLAKHVAQLEFRDHAVVQVEQQLQAIAGSLSVAKVDRIVNRESQLACGEGAESNVFFGVSARAHAGDDETSQTTVRVTQRNRAYGLQPGPSQAADCVLKASLVIQVS